MAGIIALVIITLVGIWLAGKIIAAPLKALVVVAVVVGVYIYFGASVQGAVSQVLAYLNQALHSVKGLV